MSTRTRVLILIAVAAAFAVPSLAMAGPFGGRTPGAHGRGGGFGPDGGHGLRMLDRMAVLLDLTAEQEADLQAIREATHAQVEPLMEQLRASRDAWRDAHQPGTFDEPAFRAHVESQSALHAEIAVITARAFNQAWQVLTPEQQAQLESWRTKMQQRHDRHGGRFGGPPVD